MTATPRSSNMSGSSAGQGFLLRWALGTSIAFLIGWAAAGGITLSAELRLNDVTALVRSAIGMGVAEAAGFGLLGLAAGIAGWLALRGVIAQPNRWFLTTALGWTLGGLLNGLLVGAFGGAMTGVGPNLGVPGFVIAALAAATFLLPGLLQQEVLRRQVGRSGRWALTHAVCFIAAMAVAFPTTLLVGPAVGWDFPSTQAWGMMGLLSGIVYGALTGRALVRLIARAES